MGISHNEKKLEEFLKNKNQISASDAVTAAINSSYGLNPEKVHFEGSEVKFDNIQKPSHYNSGKFETIEIIEEITKGYGDGYAAYLVGNILKYLARAPYKHESMDDDIGKVGKYYEFLTEHLKNKGN